MSASTNNSPSANSATSPPSSSTTPTPNFTNKLVPNHHVLICLSTATPSNADLSSLRENFCGQTVSSREGLDALQLTGCELVYVTGDVEEVLRLKPQLVTHERIYAIEGHSQNAQNLPSVPFFRVPVLAKFSMMGAHVRSAFQSQGDQHIFESIVKEHTFQHLTESTKPGVAYRTGAYLTPVTVDPNTGGQRFHLLRCSSNFDGATNDVGPTDVAIMREVNAWAVDLFSEATDLNHVLAQIYHNSVVNGHEKKAVIKQHSDKTKDMPSNGLMAFCSFYEGYDSKNNSFPHLEATQQITRSSTDPCDFVFRNQTVLTRLRFRPKENMNKKFDIILYPNSIFFMTLEMNRLYTHEIISSSCGIEKIPTRMGYVVRCSKTLAVHEEGKTFLFDGQGNRVPLVYADSTNMHKIKGLYAQENLTAENVHYGFMQFTLNQGDLQAPVTGNKSPGLNV